MADHAVLVWTPGDVFSAALVVVIVVVAIVVKVGDTLSRWWRR